MNLIDLDKIEIPRQRERLLDGLIYVPLADVQKALDTARVIFDEKDTTTLIAALERQVRRPVEWVEIEEQTEDRRLWLKTTAHCPACRAEQEKRRAFCPDCGQALDWEEADR